MTDDKQIKRVTCKLSLGVEVLYIEWIGPTGAAGIIVGRKSNPHMRKLLHSAVMTGVADPRLLEPRTVVAMLEIDR